MDVLGYHVLRACSRILSSLDSAIGDALAVLGWTLGKSGVGLTDYARFDDSISW